MDTKRGRDVLLSDVQASSLNILSAVRKTRSRSLTKKKAETFCSAVRDPNTTEQVSAFQSVRSAAYPRRDDEPNSQAKLDAYSPVHKNELPVHIPFMIVPSALKKINTFRAFEEKNFNFVPMAGFMVNF